jgi:hypothetical protein
VISAVVGAMLLAVLVVTGIRLMLGHLHFQGALKTVAFAFLVGLLLSMFWPHVVIAVAVVALVITLLWIVVVGLRSVT